ncbi:hypothetical protein F385_3176 [Pantoea agglomerans 299R]|nr:hypothetical protein F385_3176 [Pantoea agglomerans 299R]
MIGCQPITAPGTQLKVTLNDLFHSAITSLQHIDSGEQSE